MIDQHFPSPAALADVFGPLQAGERAMWQGRCGVAEYAFDQAASLPRWTLPEGTDVLVTDHRVLYAYTAADGHQESGELRWLWPQHLRVQPGARSRNRGAAATQIQLVCGGTDGTFPALVFAGGDLATVGEADRLANVIRQAIARFRVDNADQLGLTPSQARMLARLLIGPEFRNYQGGEGQTVSMLGAKLVSRPASAQIGPDPRPFAEREPARPAAEGTRLANYRPGRAADAARALMAARAEEATAQAEPDLASRASDLAARVASMVSRSSTHAEPVEVPLGPDHVDLPATGGEGSGAGRGHDLSGRAEAVRRTAARMAANSVRNRIGGRHAERESGVPTRGNRT
jgi:hypothetical protein